MFAALETLLGGADAIFGLPLSELLVPAGYLPQVGWGAVLGVTIGKVVTDMLIPQPYALWFTVVDVPLTVCNSSFAVLMGKSRRRLMAVLFPLATNSVATVLFLVFFVVTATTTALFALQAAALLVYGVLAIPQYLLLRYMDHLLPRNSQLA